MRRQKKMLFTCTSGGNLWETDFKHKDITNCFNINDYISSKYSPDKKGPEESWNSRGCT